MCIPFILLQKALIAQCYRMGTPDLSQWFAHSNVQPFHLPDNRLLVNASGILVSEDGKRVKENCGKTFGRLVQCETPLKANLRTILCAFSAASVQQAFLRTECAIVVGSFSLPTLLCGFYGSCNFCEE
jgi:hypothetical protein